MNFFLSTDNNYYIVLVNKMLNNLKKNRKYQLGLQNGRLLEKNVSEFFRNFKEKTYKQYQTNE